MDDKRLDRIEEKIDLLVERVGFIDVTLAKQHVSLVEHIKRTALLEKVIVPIKKHVDVVQGVVKLIFLIASIAAIIDVTIRLLK